MHMQALTEKSVIHSTPFEIYRFLIHVCLCSLSTLSSIGNYYSHLVDNSSQAAQLVGKNVKSVVKDAAKLHTTFFGSDVDETLQDMLINSLSHIRYIHASMFTGYYWHYNI